MRSRWTLSWLFGFWLFDRLIEWFGFIPTTHHSFFPSRLELRLSGSLPWCTDEAPASSPDACYFNPAGIKSSAEILNLNFITWYISEDSAGCSVCLTDAFGKQQPTQNQRENSWKNHDLLENLNQRMESIRGSRWGHGLLLGEKELSTSWAGSCHIRWREEVGRGVQGRWIQWSGK